MKVPIHPGVAATLLLLLLSCLAGMAREQDGSPGPAAEQLEDEAPWGEELWLEPQRVAVGPGKVVLEVSLPEGYKANHLAPFSVAWRSRGAHIAVAPDHASRSIASPEFPLRLEFPARFLEGEDVLTSDLAIYYCREGAGALCLIERVHLRLPVTAEREGSDTLRVVHQASEWESW